jgi:hypothetical protein
MSDFLLAVALAPLGTCFVKLFHTMGKHITQWENP